MMNPRAESVDYMTKTGAVFSPCGLYRYALWRTWGERGAETDFFRSALFLMLNPSTADETRNDPTVERCERRAREMGFRRLFVANLFAFRSTDPKGLKETADPVGPENDDFIFDLATRSKLIVCAWGAHGPYRGRSSRVVSMLREKKIPLSHLGLTNAGEPRHPLYICYAVRPTEWSDGIARTEEPTK